jgi:hypothetical protein
LVGTPERTERLNLGAARFFGGARHIGEAGALADTLHPRSSVNAVYAARDAAEAPDRADTSASDTGFPNRNSCASATLSQQLELGLRFNAFSERFHPEALTKLYDGSINGYSILFPVKFSDEEAIDLILSNGKCRKY